MPLDLAHLYALSDDARDRGAPFALSDEVRIYVLHSDNAAFKAAWRRLTKPYRTQIRMNALDDATMDRIMAEAVAETLVTGWDNIVVDGEPLPYTRANARKLLTDPRFKLLVNQLFEFANNLENYRRQEDGADLKN